jgi:glycosyltransferase involved in cell wall biosynthesis
LIDVAGKKLMESDKPKVKYRISVVIAAYNIGEFIGRAIESVLAQTRGPDEIIVVDDGSTDETAAQIKKFGAKVKYIYQDNAGPGAARNTGIKAAGGEWVAFLDGDDEWLPDNLKLQTDLLNRNPDIFWSVGNYNSCLYDENRIAPYLVPEKAKTLMRGKDYFDDYFDAFMFGAHGCTDTILVKRELLQGIGLFLPGIPFGEDIDLWFRLAIRQPKVGYVSQPIAVYYLHQPGSLIESTQTRQKMNVVCELVEQNLRLAEQYNRTEKYRQCASFYLRRFIRSCLFNDRLAPVIRDMLDRFKDLFSPGYRIFVSTLICFPRTTATGLHLISRIVRLLNLRRRVVRRPK